MGLFSSKSKSKTKVIPYDQQQLDWMLERLERLGRTPIEMYPEQMYAEMDPLQREALGMRETYARGLGNIIQPAMEAWESTLSAPDVENNPYVQGMINQQATTLNRNLEEMMPVIEANMLGVNERLGGTGEGVAKGIAARGTQEALADAAARTQMGAYQAGLGQQQYGLGAAPGMAQFGMMPADIIMGVGDVGRAEAQRPISEAVTRWNFEQQEPWQRLQNQLSMFNPLTLPYAATESKSKATPSAFSVGTQLASLGLGATDMGLGSMFNPTGTPTVPGVPGGYSAALSTPMNYNMPIPQSFMPGARMFPGAYG